MKLIPCCEVFKDEIGNSIYLKKGTRVRRHRRRNPSRRIVTVRPYVRKTKNPEVYMHILENKDYPGTIQIHYCPFCGQQIRIEGFTPELREGEQLVEEWQ